MNRPQVHLPLVVSPHDTVLSLTTRRCPLPDDPHWAETVVVVVHRSLEIFTHVYAVVASAHWHRRAVHLIRVATGEELNAMVDWVIDRQHHRPTLFIAPPGR